MRLRDKVALLAGVGTGMGRATALLFAQEGAAVAVAARQPERLEETASRIRSAGGQAKALAGDMSVEAEAHRVVQDTVQTFGHVDILYCGLGGNFDPTLAFSEMDESYWSQTLTNTVGSLFNLAHAVHPVMKAHGGGAIVNIAASFSVSQEGNPAYAAAKRGVIGLANSLAKELYPDNIRVNTISAGLFRAKLGDGAVTPASPSLSRTSSPQDIAYAALYLASDEAAWVTGQVLAVDGGVDVGTRPLWEFER